MTRPPGPAMRDQDIGVRARELLAAVLRDRFGYTKNQAERASKARTMFVLVEAALAAIEAALRSTGGEEMRLPCDVRLPPATTICAGVGLSTLLSAIELRREHGVVHFPAPPVSDTGEQG